MRIYKNQHKGIGPSYDLSVVTDAYDTLEQNHLKAVEASSALQSAVAQLDLDESEEPFRQNLINEINQTIDDNTINGFKGYALDDIIAKQGDIMANPALLGRLKANKAHKEYINFIKQRTDINQDIKDKAIEENSYSYTDKFDSNGKIIGGTEWTPNTTPVRQIDQAEVMKKVLQIVATEKGNYNNASFINSDGTVSKEWKPGVSLGVLNTITGQYEKLTEAKIQEGIDAVFKANPEYLASLTQDWETAKWKYKKTGIDTGVIDSDGSTMSLEKYKDSIYNPFKKAAAYNHKMEQINYNDANIKAYNAFLANKSKNRIGEGNEEPYSMGSRLTSSSYNVKVKNTVPTLSEAALNNATNKVRQSLLTLNDLKDYKIDVSAVTLVDLDKTRAALTMGGVPEEEIDGIMSKITRVSQINADNYIYADDLANNNDNKTNEARDIINSIDLGYPLNKDKYSNNSYGKKIVEKLGQTVDDIFAIHDTVYDAHSRRTVVTNSTPIDNIYYKINNANNLNYFLAPIGGKEVAINLGFDIKTIGGSTYIGIDKSNRHLLNKFVDGYNNIINNNGSKYKLIGGNFKDDKDGFYTFDENDNAVLMPQSITKANTQKYARIINKVRNKSEQTKISSNEYFITEGQIIDGATPNENTNRLIASDINNEPKVINAAKSTADNIQNYFKSHCRSAGFINTNVLGIKPDSDGALVMENLLDKDVATISNFLQNIDNLNKINVDMINIAGQGYKHFITIPAKDKEEPYRIVVDSIDENMTNMNNNPVLQISNKLYNSYQANKPETIAFYTDFNGTSKNIFLQPNYESSQKGYNIRYSDGTMEDYVIPFEQALSLKLLYEKMLTVSNSGLDPNKDELLINNLVQEFKQYADMYMSGAFTVPVEQVALEILGL
ncbi:hypothetical protein [Thomasclavelia cocleata]|uniref:hypothetical protein n=1 Tax=Thomasclavelia cocleata TaxID=69824 RepID=UPI00258E338A|nr:hypothetical protein [Thomasclavelia cocleata]